MSADSKFHSNNLVIADLEKRILWLENKDNRITQQTKVSFSRALNKLDKAGRSKITLFISGMGGDHFACLDIMELIRDSPSEIIIVAFEFLSSGSFLITQSVNVNKVLAVPGTRFKFHRAVKFVPSGAETLTQWNLLAMLDDAKLTDATQLLLFYQRGRPKSRIFKMFAIEATLDIERAKKYNLIDDIFNEEEFNEIKNYIYSKYKTA